MSDDDIFLETIRSANQPAEVDEEEAAAEVEDDTPEAEEQVDERVWAGKFNDPDALESAYLELQKKFHESRQPQEDEEDDDEDEYYEQQPQFFGQEPQSEEDLVAFAEQDPTNAAMWVLENVNRVPDDMANAVLEYWWQQKPWEATQYWFDQRMAAEREQLADMTMPLMEQHERGVMTDAYNILLDSVPDYDDYQERVEQFIDSRDVSAILPPGSENDPVALAEGIGTIVGILKWQEYQEAMRNQGMIVPDEENPAAPQVSTKNTTSPADMSDDDMEDLIRNMILNA